MNDGAETREVQLLRAQVRALEQLLAVHEEAVIVESRHRQEIEAKLVGKHEELARKNAELVAEEEEKAKLLVRLRGVVEELSTPILEVWDDIVALPVIGVVDSGRAAVMMDRVLKHVVSNKTRVVILDLTGVDVVDTAIAEHLIRLVKAAQLLGAQCIVTGVRPAVAQTLVGIGVDLGSLTTLRTLSHALRQTLLDNTSDERRAPARR